MRPVRRIVLAFAATAAVLAPLSACGDDGGAETGASTTTAPDASDATATSPPTTAEPPPEEQVEATYLELVDVIYRLVTSSPDPDDAELARLATEPVLGRFRDSLTTMQAENHIVEPGPRTSHRVMSVELEQPDRAILRDCSVGNDKTIDQDDRSVVDEGLTTRVLEATVVSMDGSWLVSSIATVVRLDGEVECPE